MAAGQTSQLQRRVRGLLNRMSDSNLPGIVADVLQLAEQEGERAIAETITAELLQVWVCLLPLCRHSVAASLHQAFCGSADGMSCCSTCCILCVHVCLPVHRGVHMLDKPTVV